MYKILLILQSENGIWINHKRIQRREHVVLGNNDIISFLPDGSADYRYVNADTGQESPTPTVGLMSPPMMLPPTPGQSPPHATPEPDNSVGISVTEINVAADAEQSDQYAVLSPLFEDGSSSIRSADTPMLPAWAGSPVSYVPSTPPYSPGVSFGNRI